MPSSGPPPLRVALKDLRPGDRLRHDTVLSVLPLIRDLVRVQFESGRSLTESGDRLTSVFNRSETR